MFRLVLPYVAMGLLGVVVGVVGTGGHRYEPYWGSVCVLVLVVSAAVFARAYRAWAGLMAFALTWLAVVLFLYSANGPGDSIVILSDGLGKVWLYGGAVAAASPAMIPEKYVKEQRHG